MSDYLLVHKSILPHYLDQVLMVQSLLDTKACSTVTEAVKQAGISRATYYRYKDLVYAPTDDRHTHHAIVSVLLADEKGALSALLASLSQEKANILTISQAIPVAGKANVLLSLDISQLSIGIDELIQRLKQLPAVLSITLNAMD